MRSTLFSIILLCFAVTNATADVNNYKIQSAKKAAPKELKEDVRKLLSEEIIQFSDKNGDLIAELWFRETIPVKQKPAAEQKAKYRDVPETTILGALRFAKEWKDYRGQKISPGVYSLRLGYQPQDGDHVGTAPHPEFGILLVAKFEPKAGTLDSREMVERSMASINTSHPAVLLLFPNNTDKKTPALQGRAREHIVLNLFRPVAVGDDKSGSLGIGLTLVGEASE